MPQAQSKNVSPEAQELRERIAAAGLTFREFGKLVGLTRNQLYKVLTVQTPRPELRKRIDQVLAARSK